MKGILLTEAARLKMKIRKKYPKLFRDYFSGLPDGVRCSLKIKYRSPGKSIEKLRVDRRIYEQI